MTGSRRSALTKSATLTLAALALAGLSLAGTASAQDPAFIGGTSYNDPANLQSRGRPQGAPMRMAPGYDPRSRQSAPPAQAIDPNTAPLSPQEVAAQIQGMLNQLDESMTAPRGNNPYDRSRQVRYDQSMRQAKALMARNGNQFSSSTKALFMEMQALDEEQERDRMRYGGASYDNPDAAMDRGMRQAEDGMRRLSDVLLPMLRDVKKAVDTGIQNAANQRR